jgi:hypothetical protein
MWIRANTKVSKLVLRSTEDDGHGDDDSETEEEMDVETHLLERRGGEGQLSYRARA